MYTCNVSFFILNKKKVANEVELLKHLPCIYHVRHSGVLGKHFWGGHHKTICRYETTIKTFKRNNSFHGYGFQISGC